MRKLVSVQKIMRNYELKLLRVSRNYNVDDSKITTKLLLLFTFATTVYEVFRQKDV
jgi:hypothetical protein